VCINVTLRHVCLTTVALEKYCIFWVCVSAASVIQHAVHMCHVIFSSVAWLHHIFPHYIINSTIFRKRYWTYKVCFFSTTFVCNISHSRKN
jgi:hypothetical protein